MLYCAYMKAATDKHIFPIIVERDEAGFFVATNPVLPGCYSQGKSMEEALCDTGFDLGDIFPG